MRMVVDEVFSSGKWTCPGNGVARVELNKIFVEVSAAFISLSTYIAARNRRAIRPPFLDWYHKSWRFLEGDSRCSFREWAANGNRLPRWRTLCFE
jgi:hypothetical protein